MTYIYEIEIDDESTIVKEYANDNELASDLTSYRFAVLPVIGKGVEIIDVETIEFGFTD